jgi:hypothetical protein
MSRMGPIVGFLFKDRFDMRGWEIFPSRMSFAEVGFILLSAYEIVRLCLWLKS